MDFNEALNIAQKFQIQQDRKENDENRIAIYYIYLFVRPAVHIVV